MLPKYFGRLAKTPDAEVFIDDVLVRRLLHDQHPDLAHLDIALVDAGWDNTMFRLGDSGTDCLSVRLPRRQIAAALMNAIAAYGPISEATLQRVLGWAIFFGVALLDTGLVDHSGHAAIDEKTLRRIAETGDSSI